MRLYTLGILVSLLTGCITPPPFVAHLDPKVAAVQRTDDPVEQRRRFGLVADLIGKYFVSQFNNKTVFTHYKGWLVPGASLEIEATWCDPECETSRVVEQWNPNNGDVHTGVYNRFNSLDWRMDAPKPVRNGVRYNAASGKPIVYDANTGMLSGGFLPASEITRDEYFSRLRRFGEVAREESRENAQMWSAVVGGLQAAAQEQAVMNQRRPQPQSGVNQTLQNAPRPAPAINTTPQSTPTSPARSSPAESNLSPPTRTQAPARTALSPPTAPANAVASRASSTPEAQDSTGDQRSRRNATPEAIVVCTRPDAKGAFECDTPVDVNLRGGPNNGIATWRTPDTMITALSASCPSARRLPSTTHVVWGCGFGATNNSNSMDRSGGVDVRGRETYYCTEKQTSCRSTQP
jgi:hypothetical protein